MPVLSHDMVRAIAALDAKFAAQEAATSARGKRVDSLIADLIDAVAALRGSAAPPALEVGVGRAAARPFIRRVLRAPGWTRRRGSRRGHRRWALTARPGPSTERCGGKNGAGSFRCRRAYRAGCERGRERHAGERERQSCDERAHGHSLNAKQTSTSSADGCHLRGYRPSNCAPSTWASLRTATLA